MSVSLETFKHCEPEAEPNDVAVGRITARGPYMFMTRQDEKEACAEALYVAEQAVAVAGHPDNHKPRLRQVL